ncbi:MAG: DNA replication and repair protein RecF [Candidatus Dependentiae bacterium ADurb.Bin331]|nr:MAG: DNA replication and repair protein RecF [Candidatus Dependentiae bacterium ADurb.Bin331]
MQIGALELKNFRCFPVLELEINAPLVLISGTNGSGKTSLLEALHYACYLRSFRTHVPRELLLFDQSTFFIKLAMRSAQFEHELQVGFSAKKKLVKIDHQPINSYKELIDYYRTITLTEDDLLLIKGGPDGRRLFIDQAIMLHDPQFVVQLRTLKNYVQQRTALLNRTHTIVDDSYVFWTQQLFEQSQLVQQKRIPLLLNLENRVNQLLESFNSGATIQLRYHAKKSISDSTWPDWFAQYEHQLPTQEYILKRSLFGAHVDDVEIYFKGHQAKNFASRGQQKLILMLLKLAQLQELKALKGDALLLLDDFMNDFDKPTAQRLIGLIKELCCQVIFTCPLEVGYSEQLLMEQGCQKIELKDRQ